MVIRERFVSTLGSSEPAGEVQHPAFALADRVMFMLLWPPRRESSG
jgi:hypothetical protein